MIFEYYRKQSDILLVQETHSEKETEHIWRSQWGGPAIFSHGSTSSKGVAIFFRKEAYFNISNIMCDFEGRFVGCNISTLNGLQFSLCNIYGPNQDKPSFFQALQQNLSELHPEKIVMGDYNVVMDPSLDRHESVKNNVRCLTALKISYQGFITCVTFGDYVTQQLDDTLGEEEITKLAVLILP